MSVADLSQMHPRDHTETSSQALQQEPDDGGAQQNPQQLRDTHTHTHTSMMTKYTHTHAVTDKYTHRLCAHLESSFSSRLQV